MFKINELAANKPVMDFGPNDLKSRLCFNNYFDVEHYRNGILLAKYKAFNDVTDEGVNLLWNVMFHSTSQITTWYLGLISNASFSTLSNGDVMASHAGWLEFTGYTSANRLAWGNGASSARAMTNGTAASFTINTNGTVYGLFVTSDNTLGGTSGKLWATAGFPALVPVVSTDVLKATYTISA